RDDCTVHLHRLALDSIPNRVPIGLTSIREDELPLRKVHLVRWSFGHHLVCLIRRSRGRRDQSSEIRRWNCPRFCFCQDVSPALLVAVKLSVLRTSVLLNLGLGLG